MQISNDSYNRFLFTKHWLPTDRMTFPRLMCHVYGNSTSSLVLHASIDADTLFSLLSDTLIRSSGSPPSPVANIGCIHILDNGSIAKKDGRFQRMSSNVDHGPMTIHFRSREATKPVMDTLVCTMEFLRDIHAQVRGEAAVEWRAQKPVLVTLHQPTFLQVCAMLKKVSHPLQSIADSAQCQRSTDQWYRDGKELPEPMYSHRPACA